MTRRLLTLALLAAAACSSPSAPASATAVPLDGRLDSAAFEFHFASHDTVDVAWQEAYHAWATTALGIPQPQKIQYFKYLSRAHMSSHTGVGNANAWAHPTRPEIHTIWPRDNHEVVHRYSSAWGMPVALWTEGLAVAFQTDPAAGDLVPRWNRVPLHDHARQFLADGRLIPIGDMLATDGFRRHDANVTYPQAGSFMLFVIERCGLDAVRRLYELGRPGDSAPAVRDHFQSACRRSLDDVERDWRTLLTR